MTNSGNLLVGSIGTSDYNRVQYELDGRTVTTDISPIALVNLCPVDAALIVRTPEAGEKNDERLETAFSEARIDYQLVDIELIQTKSEIDDILNTIVGRIRSERFDQDSVILDISHSFRTLPIVFLLALMQIEALEDSVSLDRIYYSRFAGSDDRNTAPVIDLTYLRTLIEWYDAFEAAQRAGTFRGLRLLLEERRDEIYREGVTLPEKDQFSSAISAFGGAQQEIDAGFPLEAGIKTKRALEELAAIDREAFVGPEGMIMEPLEVLLDGFETDQDVSEKAELTLTSEELRREADIVEFYMEHEKYRVAVECARELMINRFLYDAGLTDEWLNRENRTRITPASGNQHEYFRHDVSEVQELWDQTSQARNTYAHVGFKSEKRPRDDDIVAFLEKLCERIDDDGFWQV